MSEQVNKTIDEVLKEFLAEQEARWSYSTYEKYENVICLLKKYMEAYWDDQEEYERITKAGGTYCGTHGPKDIAKAFWMFLGYFLPNKVMCGIGTEKAAPNVIRKLGKWLVKNGYDPDADRGVF